MKARVGGLRRLSAAAVVAAVLVAVVVFPPPHASAQTVRIGVWGGVTSDLKPGSGSSGSTLRSGPSFGVGVVQGSYGAHVAYADLSDSDDRWTLDLLLGYRRSIGTAVYVEAQAGPSFYRRTFDTRLGDRQELSTDWLVGPVVGVTSSIAGSAELELAFPVQYRWSPDLDDFLHLGVRAGLRFGV